MVGEAGGVALLHVGEVGGEVRVPLGEVAGVAGDVRGVGAVACGQSRSTPSGFGGAGSSSRRTTAPRAMPMCAVSSRTVQSPSRVGSADCSGVRAPTAVRTFPNWARTAARVLAGSYVRARFLAGGMGSSLGPVLGGPRCRDGGVEGLAVPRDADAPAR